MVGHPSSRWHLRRRSSAEARPLWLAGWRGVASHAPAPALALRTASPDGAALELPLAQPLPCDESATRQEPPGPGPGPRAEGPPRPASGPVPDESDPKADGSLVERVFLAADSLAERLARTMPIERNGGQFAALLLIDSDASSSRSERDDLIERLASCKRLEDWLGLDDDGHFALILTQLGVRADWAARRAEQFAARLVRGPAERESRGPRLWVGVSMLAPVGPGPVDGSDTTLESSVSTAATLAGLALARARQSADREIRFADPAIDAMLHSLGTMDRDLREAVEAGRFVIQFQPIIDRHGRLDRAEALLRWRHANGDLIPADRFFDRAEALGLAVPLGYQVLEVVVRQLTFWAHHPALARVPIAVNLSASQLGDRHLIDRLTALLQRFDVDPTRIAIELSESVVALASDDSVRRLQSLYALGCRLSIDGFGRGWLTWSRLRQLPLRELKLPIASPAGVGQAVRLAALAQEIGLDVTATRIETREQWRDATRARFSGYQGHLIGRPSASTMGLLGQLQGNGGDTGWRPLDALS